MPYTFKHGDRPLEGITVQRAVGRGGFGEVYYALTDSGKQIALKYLRENPEIELRGIAHVMNLKSPHLITIYDVKNNAAGEPFVIMEYVSGPSLRELMQAEPAGLGAQKAAFFLKGIASGLSYLHERGIVHRDLKPANIFYDDGYVKIGDYGLSKHISVSKHSGQTVSVGTVHYMAPEIGSGNYTKAIDIYALGVILFEMLTGQLPYSGASMAEILMRHLRDRPDLSNVPAPFAPVIAKALAKDPSERYQDADEMLAALMECGEISQSVNSFDASALSQVPRSPEACDTEPTRTSPQRPQPIPPLDARGPWPQTPGGAVPPLPPRLQQKLDRLSAKLEQKVARIEKKFGPGAAGPFVRAARRERPAGHRRSQIFILVAVTIAIAAVLGITAGGRGQPESRAVALGLLIVGGTLGPLLTHLRFLQRSATRNTLLDRLAYASVGGLFMMPGFACASDEVGPVLARVIVAPIAALLLCDWNRRIEAGRLGRVDGWAAFWPAVVGLVAANIVHSDQYAWTAAGVCAAISLLTQATAAMWPPGRPVAAPGPAPLGGRQPVGPAEPGVAAIPVVDQREVPREAGIAVPQAWPMQTPASPGNLDGASAVAQSDLAPRGLAIRVFFGVLATCSAAATLGSFFALVAGQPSDKDVRAGLLFTTLAGVAWMPFLLTKALCCRRYKVGIWRGTLRMLVVSLGLTLSAGMITCLTYSGTNDGGETSAAIDRDETAAAIFGLVAGAVIALVALGVPGRRPLPSVPTDAPGASADTPAPVVVSAMQPSFVGRTANAGVSFLGKLFLMAGLLIALGQDLMLDYARREVASGSWHMAPEATTFVRDGIPRGLSLLPLVFGSVLLVVARQRAGVAALFRASIGCVLLLWAALVTIFWGSQPLQILLTGTDLSALHASNMWAPLALTGLSVAVGGLLLLWPNEQREKTIVI